MGRHLPTPLITPIISMNATILFIMIAIANYYNKRRISGMSCLPPLTSSPLCRRFISTYLPYLNIFKKDNFSIPPYKYDMKTILMNSYSNHNQYDFLFSSVCSLFSFYF